MDGYNILLICSGLILSQLLSVGNTLLPYFYQGEHLRNQKVKDVVKKVEDNEEKLKHDIQVQNHLLEKRLEGKMKNIEEQLGIIQKQHKVVLANCKTTSSGEYKTILGYTDNSLEIAKRMTNKVGETVAKEFDKYLNDIGKRTDNGVNNKKLNISLPKSTAKKNILENEKTREWISKGGKEVTEMKKEVDEYINNNQTYDKELQKESKAWGETLRCGSSS